MLDGFIPNESETALLIDLPVETLEQGENSPLELLTLGVSCVAIPLGAR